MPFMATFVIIYRKTHVKNDIVVNRLTINQTIRILKIGVSIQLNKNKANV